MSHFFKLVSGFAFMSMKIKCGKLWLISRTIGARCGFSSGVSSSRLVSSTINAFQLQVGVRTARRSHNRSFTSRTEAWSFRANSGFRVAFPQIMKNSARGIFSPELARSTEARKNVFVFLLFSLLWLICAGKIKKWEQAALRCMTTQDENGGEWKAERKGSPDVRKTSQVEFKKFVVLGCGFSLSCKGLTFGVFMLEAKQEYRGAVKV